MKRSPSHKDSHNNKKLPYIRPEIAIYNVTLESPITTASVQIKNLTDEVKEDWGDEISYNTDIEFTN